MRSVEVTGRKDPTSSVWSFTGGPWLPELSGKVALLHKWFSHGCPVTVRQMIPATMLCLDTHPKATEPGDHDGSLNCEREQTFPPCVIVKYFIQANQHTQTPPLEGKREGKCPHLSTGPKVRGVRQECICGAGQVLECCLQDTTKGSGQKVGPEGSNSSQVSVSGCWLC